MRVRKEHHLEETGSLWKIEFKSGAGNGWIERSRITETGIYIKLCFGDPLNIEVEAEASNTSQIEMVSYLWTPIIFNQSVAGQVDEDQRKQIVHLLRRFKDADYETISG